MSVNKCFLVGNITRDPVAKTTPGGMQVLEFGIAVNDRRKNQQTGQWDDVPSYFECNVFGRRAEALGSILVKGMKVSIEGRLRWSSWSDKDTGQKRSKVDIVVDEIEFMSQRQGGYQQAPQMAPRAAQRPQFQPQNANGYQSATQQQMAPQMAPQQAQMQYSQPAYSAPQQQQYAPPAQQAPQQQDIYIEDTDIPF